MLSRTLGLRGWALASVLLAMAAAHADVSAQASRAPAFACKPPNADTLDANFIPAGYGSLRREDISVTITLTGGMQVSAIPLDERFIRLLAPDSYKGLCQVRVSKQQSIDSIANRERLQKYSLWYVTFYGVERGEVRFSPREFVIKNVGRDFRPIDFRALTSGFGNYRLKQLDTQIALYVFDGQLDANQPLTAQIEGVQSNTDWLAVLRRIEQERSLIRSRAAAKP